MHHYYLFTYENVTAKTMQAVSQVLDDKKVEAYVQYADPRGMLLIVDQAEPDTVAKMVQQEVWNRNSGLLCEYREVQQDDESIEDLI